MPPLLNVSTDYFVHEATEWNNANVSGCKLNYSGLVFSKSLLQASYTDTQPYFGKKAKKFTKC